MSSKLVFAASLLLPQLLLASPAVTYTKPAITTTPSIIETAGMAQSCPTETRWAPCEGCFTVQIVKPTTFTDTACACPTTVPTITVSSCPTATAVGQSSCPKHPTPAEWTVVGTEACRPTGAWA